MPSSFAQTTRSLARDSTTVALTIWGGAALLMALWTAWFCLSRVAVYEVSTQARLEVRQASHALVAPAPGRVVRSMLALGAEVREGELLVELDAGRERLALAEVQARRAGLARQGAALESEAMAQRQAAGQAEAAMRATLASAEARAQESAAAVVDALTTAQRLQEESAAGAVAPVEAQQARNEARRLAAGRDTAQAELRRLHAQSELGAAELRAQGHALRRQAASLGAELTAAQALAGRLALEVERLQLRAPVAGRIAEVAGLRVGDVVGTAQKLASIVPVGDLIAVADFEPATALGRIREGQAARLRLSGFAWAQYGSVEATVARVAGELRDAKLRVEFALHPPFPAHLPLQHGLPGAVEVQIDELAPATLLLRASGQLLAARP